MGQALNARAIQASLDWKHKILKKYLDKEIVAYLTNGDKKEMIEGTLLSYSGDQLMLKRNTCMTTYTTGGGMGTTGRTQVRRKLMCG